MKQFPLCNSTSQNVRMRKTRILVPGRQCVKIRSNCILHCNNFQSVQMLVHDDASTLSSNFHASRNSFSLDAVGKVTGNNSQMQVRDERDGLRERKSEEKESKEANCS